MRPLTTERWKRYIALAVGLVVLALTYCAPRYTTVRVSNKTYIDIISMGAGVDQYPGRIDTLTPKATVLNYYSTARQEDVAERELRNVLPLAIFVANRASDSLIVIEQSVPLGSRWIGLSRNRFYRVRRGQDGMWRLSE